MLSLGEDTAEDTAAFHRTAKMDKLSPARDVKQVPAPVHMIFVEV